MILLDIIVCVKCDINVKCRVIDINQVKCDVIVSLWEVKKYFSFK